MNRPAKLKVTKDLKATYLEALKKVLRNGANVYFVHAGTNPSDFVVLAPAKDGKTILNITYDVAAVLDRQWGSGRIRTWKYDLPEALVGELAHLLDRNLCTQTI